MTDSPSEPGAEATSPAAKMAARFAELIGSGTWSAEHGTAMVVVARDRWVDAHRILKEHLPFFSFLSAVDWSREVRVGDPPAGDDLEERFQVISRLSDSAGPDAVILSVDLAKDDAVLDTVTGVYGGAEWHERETAEMFGIRFEGHPNLVNLYLPDGFEGNPLRKSFGLLSREVKPWPGAVDVEDMPSTENPEGGGGR